MPAPIPGPHRFRPATIALTAALAIVAALVAASFWSDDARNVGAGTPSSEVWWRVEGPGILRPETIPADRATIGDDEEILGVIVDGQPRAYRLSAFLDPSAHIVNDVIGDRPITVAYCNLSDCARAYAGPPGGAPLDIAQGGLKDGQMIVRAAGGYFWHRDGRPFEPAPSVGAGAVFPYPDYPMERRKWGDWRREHPTTDLYTTPTHPSSDSGKETVETRRPS